MRKLLLLLVMTLALSGMHAQTLFDKGVLAFNAGVGGPNNYGAIPTVNFSGEVGVIPTGNIGVVSFGGLVEFQMGVHDVWWTGDNELFPRFYVGPRAAWHFTGLNTDVFDVYAGVGMGVVFDGSTENYDSDISINPDTYVGGRWMFSPGMGLFAELGMTGLSFAKFGVTFGL